MAMLYGSIGVDTFSIPKKAVKGYSETYTITGFSVGQDRLDLSQTGISNIETLDFLRQEIPNGLGYKFYTDGIYQQINLENQWIDSLGSSDVVLSTTNSAGTQISAPLQSMSDLFGGAGNDTLIGSLSSDRLFGEADSDSLDGGAGDDTLVGGAGNDTLIGGAGADKLYGGTGGDVFVLQNAITYESKDTIADFNMAEGDKLDVRSLGIGDLDTLKALSYRGSSNFFDFQSVIKIITKEIGIEGVDIAFLGESNVYLNTAATNDVLTASSSSGLFGAGGNDTLNGSTGGDRLFGEVGNDRLYGNAGYDALYGGAGDDMLDGGLGDDTVYGGAGNDQFFISNDNSKDLMIGGAGIDTVDYSIISSSVKVNLGTTAQQKVVDTTYRYDTIREIENVSGGTAADRLVGNSGANVLDGNAGNDSLIGGLGNDSLIGGLGNDSLNGGDGNDNLIGGASKDLLVGGYGNDVFDFNALSEMGTTITTWDVISDFKSGQDKIDLSTLDANTATTTNDAFNGTLISSTASFTAAGQLKLVAGVLYGNTNADATAEFAIGLTGVTALTAADFVL